MTNLFVMQALEQKTPGQLSLLRGGVVALLSVLASIVGLLVFLHGRHSQQTHREIEETLTTIASLKASQIGDWYAERKADAEATLQITALQNLFAEVLLHPDRTEARQELLRWMEGLRTHYKYRRIILADSEGRIRLSSPAIAATPERAELYRNDFQKLKNQGQTPHFFFRRESEGPMEEQDLHLIFVTCVGATPEKFDGLIYFDCNPNDYLFPLIQHWPVPSKTGEFALIQCDGGDVLYLNTLRHAQDPPLSIRYPIAQYPERPASLAARGTEGFVRGLDYREVPVLAGIRKVKNTPWIVIAKIDEAEALASLQQFLWTTVVLGGLIFGVAVLFLASLYIQQKNKKLVAEKSERTRWLTLVESVGDGLWDWDIPQKTTWFSPQWKALLGYSQDEISDSFSEWEKRVHPDDLPGANAAIQAFFQGRTPIYTHEHRMLHKDGRWRWHMARGVIVERNQAGQPIRMVGIQSDITDSKRNQESLQETRDYLENLLNFANAPIIVWDTEQHITKFNHAFERITGRAAKDVIGMHLSFLFPEKTREQSLQHITQASAGVYWESVEIPIQHVDGTVHWLLWNSAVVRRPSDHTIVATIAQGHDITGRKLAADELQRVSSLLEQVMNASRDFIFLKDRQLRTILCNTSYAAAVGKQPKDLYGKTDIENGWLMDHVKGDTIKNLEGFERDDREALSGKVVRNSNDVATVNGSVRVFDTFKIPLRDQDNKIIAVLGMSRDITELKATEQALQEAKEQAEAANQSKSAFLAMMSHEIRTPMNAVIGFAQVLMDTKLDADQKEYVGLIFNSGKSLLALINDILDFSKIEAGHIMLDMRPFDFHACVREVHDTLRFFCNAKQITIGVELADGMPTLFLGDAQRIRQILVNLVANAIKFTEHGGVRIVASAQPHSDRAPLTDSEREFIQSSKDPSSPRRLVVEIHDTGIGMTPEQQTNLFRPFQQADKWVAKKFGGTGLGLAISLKLAHLMGGTITVTSRPGHGSVFRLEIPTVAILPVDNAVSTQALLPPDRTSNPHFAKVSVRILVVEDNLVNQRLMEKMLQRMGYACVCVEDGLSALKALQNGTFHLVFLDVQLPDISGIVVAKRHRAWEKENRRTPVYLIACTAFAMKEDREKCLQAGMDDYLSKPIAMPDLVEVLQRFHKSVASDAFETPALELGTGQAGS
jgi:PAS domain S-box-containing protein